MLKNKNGISTNFNKKRSGIADAIAKIVFDLDDFWPLTVRQVYYQLVAKLIIENALREYKKTSQILVKLRENEVVPWYAIEDRARRTTGKRGASSVSDFLERQFSAFANPEYYGRCYVQKQNVYVEMSTEKDALSSVIEDAVWGYCTRLNIVRGQTSASMIERMSQRFIEAAARGQRVVLLHMGDLDPSGVAIPKAIKRNLWERHDVDVEVVRVALNPEQVRQYGLPENPESAKPKDPNFKTWLREYGSDQAAVELDAVHPKELQQIVRDALNSVYDMAAFDTEIQKEQEERQVLKIIRRETSSFLSKRFPEYFNGGGPC
jgi:hypothetical protein